MIADNGKSGESSQSDKLKHPGSKNRAKDKAHLKAVLDPKGTKSIVFYLFIIFRNTNFQKLI